MNFIQQYFLGTAENPTNLWRLKFYRFFLTWEWQWNKQAEREK